MRVNFQGQVNRLISEGAVFTRMAKGLTNSPEAMPEKQSPQSMAANKAKENARNEIISKKTQKEQFMEYLRQQPSNLGGKIGDLPENLQEQIASQYTEKQRNELLRGEKDGKH